MTDEYSNLNNFASDLKRLNSKIKLLQLITEAKEAYDTYDFDTALNHLEEAYRINPTNPVVLRGLGCIQQFNKNYTKAVSFYKKALKYSTEKEIEYTLIGAVFYLQDYLDEAVKYFSLAINANDDYDAAYEGRNQAMLENHIKKLEFQDLLNKYFS